MWATAVAHASARGEARLHGGLYRVYKKPLTLNPKIPYHYGWNMPETGHRVPEARSKIRALTVNPKGPKH